MGKEAPELRKDVAWGRGDETTRARSPGPHLCATGSSAGPWCWDFCMSQLRAGHEPDKGRMLLLEQERGPDSELRVVERRSGVGAGTEGRWLGKEVSVTAFRLL